MITGWPYCAKCEKPCDSVERVDEPLRKETFFVVRCHGDKEITRVDPKLLLSAKEVSFGNAFVAPRLLNGEE